MQTIVSGELGSTHRTEKNRLSLTLEGHLSTEEVAKAASSRSATAEELEPGFDQANDRSSFQPADEEALEHIERGKRGIVENGNAATCRVVSESTASSSMF